MQNKLLKRQLGLIKACKEGNFNKAKLFIDDGLNVNFFTDFRMTPLHYAALYGKSDIVRLLLSTAIFIDPKNKMQKTPLHFAAAGKNPMCTQLLLKAGADVHALDIYRNTPLHLAADCLRVESAKLLLFHGAEEAIMNLVDRTPYDTAYCKSVSSGKMQSQKAKCLKLLKPPTDPAFDDRAMDPAR